MTETFKMYLQESGEQHRWTPDDHAGIRVSAYIVQGDWNGAGFTIQGSYDGENWEDVVTLTEDTIGVEVTDSYTILRAIGYNPAGIYSVAKVTVTYITSAAEVNTVASTLSFLAAASPAVTTTVEMLSGPAKVVVMYVTNVSASPATYQIFLSSDGSYTTANALFYDIPIGEQETVEIAFASPLSLSGPSDSIGVRSSVGSALTFTALGS